MHKALILGVATAGFVFAGFAAPAAAEECSNAVQLIKRTQQNPGPTAANTANPMVLCPSDADADGDGRISRQEWQDAVLGWHSGLDEDEDGHLSVDEINRLQTGNYTQQD